MVLKAGFVASFVFVVAGVGLLAVGSLMALCGV